MSKEGDWGVLEALPEEQQAELKGALHGDRIDRRPKQRAGIVFSDRDRSGSLMVERKAEDGLILTDEEAMALSGVIMRGKPAKAPKLKETQDKWMDLWHVYMKTGMTRAEFAGANGFEIGLLARMFNWVEETISQSERGTNYLRYFVSSQSADLQKLIKKQEQYEAHGPDSTDAWIRLQGEIRKTKMLLAKAEGVLETRVNVAQAPKITVVFGDFKMSREEGPRVLSVEATVEQPLIEEARRMQDNDVSEAERGYL